MKLLFDQNLSPRLPRLLVDIFPDSAHVRELGMRDATDTKIWEYAKANGFAIVSKDSDFQARSLLLGHPPKFIFSEIPNRKPYVHNGRQIDGSLTISGTTYLVELKFTAEHASAPDIDTFYKKVTSKADNTMGILVSISGYSSVAREEASGNKTPLLLLDHGHIYLVLGGMMGLADVIERIRRHASQTGEAYLSVSDFSG